MPHKFSEVGTALQDSFRLRPDSHGATNENFPGLPALAKATKQQRPLNVCILAADFVGPVRNGGVGTAYRYLAEFLVELGHKVTVLYALGQECENGKIQEWVDFYHQLGIEFVPLQTPQVRSSKGVIGASTKNSYDTYEWLKTRSFDLVHVSEWQGVGYFSLLAKNLGLAFRDTLFCVKASSPTVWGRLGGGRPLSNHQEMMVSYMERRSMELADVAVSGSLHLLRWMLDYGYDLSRKRCFVQPNLMGTNTLPQLEHRQKTGARVAIDECVFFGRLELRKGLHIFCYAITQMARAGTLPKKIIFLGKTAASFPARQFIKKQSANWPRDLEYEILTNYDQPTALKFLQEGSRLAIIPSLLENSSFAIYECLNYQIPFLASDRGGNPELIAKKDHQSILFSAHPNALAKQLINVLQQGALIAEPSFDNDRNRQIWQDWHAALGQEGVIQELGVSVENQDTAPPLVSVCLAHYERPELVHQAIASLKAQTYSNFEVILVDDGSHSKKAKDNLAEIEKDFIGRGWKVVRQENLYLGASRNTAARNASGKYLMFMDDDNFAKPTEIEVFVQIAESSKADILTCFSDAFNGLKEPDADNISHRITPIGADVATGMFLNVYGDSNCFVRCESFEKIGGFSEDFGVGLDDQEFFSRAILSGLKLEVVPEALYYYRLPIGRGLKKMHYNTTAGKMRVLQPFLKAIPSAYNNILLYAVGLENRSTKQKVGKLSSDPRRFFADSHYPILRILRIYYGDNPIGRFNTKTLRWFLKTFVNDDG